MFEELMDACSSGDSTRLQSLLSQPSGLETTLSARTVPYNATTMTVPAAQLMLQACCPSGDSATRAKTLLESIAPHIEPKTLITRDTCLAAIESPSALDLFKYLTSVKPDIVTMDLGHLGDPLSYAIHRKNFDLIAYLLDNGADPNARCGGHQGPGHHLRLAAKLSSVDVARLLIAHGAHVAGSGATHTAAERGDVHMLEVLVASGADVNERLNVNLGFLGRPGGDFAKERAREKPLDVSIRCGQRDAENWLRSRGAERGG